MRMVLTSLVSIVTLSQVAWAQGQQPVEWSAFEFHQFITQARTSPQAILRMDNNGRLVLLAAEGIDVAELHRVTGASASQIQLLVEWNLLTRRDDTIRTAFPILDSVETTAFRVVTARAAGPLSRLVAADAGALRHRLETIGRGSNAFSIVFSYVLDGLIWDLWEGSGRIPGRALTQASPFWAGEVWANRPARSDVVGTNSISDSGVRLNVTWSRAALPHMRPFVADLRALEALFDGFAAGRLTDPYAKQVFASYNLFDDAGRFTVPVITRDPSDAIHAMALRIATTLAERIPESLDLQQLRAQFGFRTDAQALIVTYHELMWDILAAFEGKGVVQRPKILTGAGKIAPADVSALVFGVRGGSGNY